MKKLDVDFGFNERVFFTHQRTAQVVMGHIAKMDLMVRDTGSTDNGKPIPWISAKYTVKYKHPGSCGTNEMVFDDVTKGQLYETEEAAVKAMLAKMGYECGLKKIGGK